MHTGEGNEAARKVNVVIPVVPYAKKTS